VVRGLHFTYIPAKAEEVVVSESDTALWGLHRQLSIKYKETDIVEVDEKSSVEFLTGLLPRIPPADSAFSCQLAYELGEYHFFREKFGLAIDFFGQAEVSFKRLVPNNPQSFYWFQYLSFSNHPSKIK